LTEFGKNLFLDSLGSVPLSKRLKDPHAAGNHRSETEAGILILNTARLPRILFPGPRPVNGFRRISGGLTFHFCYAAADADAALGYPGHGGAHGAAARVEPVHD
jgi:hypothetical protein